MKERKDCLFIETPCTYKHVWILFTRQEST